MFESSGTNTRRDMAIRAHKGCLGAWNRGCRQQSFLRPGMNVLVTNVLIVFPIPTCKEFSFNGYFLLRRKYTLKHALETWAFVSACINCRGRRRLYRFVIGALAASSVPSTLADLLTNWKLSVPGSTSQDGDFWWVSFHTIAVWRVAILGKMKPTSFILPSSSPPS